MTHAHMPESSRPIPQPGPVTRAIRAAAIEHDLTHLSAPVAAEPARGCRMPLPDPQPFPEWYAMHVQGDCCSPEIPHGCHVMCNSLKAPERGDFVVIHFTPKAAAQVGYDAWVKRLVFMQRPPRPGRKRLPPSNVEPCVCVEQLNPPRSYTIPWTAVREVHWCHGKVPADVTVILSPEAEARRAAERAARADRSGVAA